MVNKKFESLLKKTFPTTILNINNSEKELCSFRAQNHFGCLAISAKASKPL